jgi:hypothetical protein
MRADAFAGCSRKTGPLFETPRVSWASFLAKVLQGAQQGTRRLTANAEPGYVLHADEAPEIDGAL